MYLANQNIDTSCSKDETFKKQENLMTGKIQFYFFWDAQDVNIWQNVDNKFF